MLARISVGPFWFQDGRLMDWSAKAERTATPAGRGS